MSETDATTHEARDSMLCLIKPVPVLDALRSAAREAKVAVPAVQGKINDRLAALRQSALRPVT